MTTTTPAARLSYVQRFAIAWRYARHAMGHSHLGAAVYALTDPIAALNPIYSKPAYVDAMIRNTAAAFNDYQWQRYMARRYQERRASR